MAVDYKVKTSELDSVKNQVSNIAKKYEEEYKKLFSTVKSIEKSNEGDDIREFIAKVTPYEKNFIEMKEELEAFSRFLGKASEDYLKTEAGNKARTKDI